MRPELRFLEAKNEATPMLKTGRSDSIDSAVING